MQGPAPRSFSAVRARLCPGSAYNAVCALTPSHGACYSTDNNMSEQEKPTVVVVGATSKQGSSVVCSLLESANFHVKALTKDSNSSCACWPVLLPLL